jgi:hypothetical protein
VCACAWVCGVWVCVVASAARPGVRRWGTSVCVRGCVEAIFNGVCASWLVLRGQASRGGAPVCAMCVWFTGLQGAPEGPGRLKTELHV